MSEFHEWRTATARFDAPPLPALLGSAAVSVIAFEVLGAVTRATVFWLFFAWLGVDVQVALWIIAGLLIERAVVFMFTGWRPPIARVAIATLPGAVTALVLGAGAHWPPEAWTAAGMIVHAATLWYLGSASPEIVDEQSPPLGL